MSLTIREYNEKDQSALSELVAGLIDHMAMLDTLKLFKPRKEIDAQKYIALRLPVVKEEHGKVLLACWDNTPIGYLMATIETLPPVIETYKFPCKKGVIDALYVVEEFRRKGVSTKLIAEIEQYFREKGCTHSEVGALVVNEQAKGFYRKQGYKEQFVDLMKKL